MNDMEPNKPPTGSSQTSRLIEIYQNYPEAQRRILQVLSVIYQPINQTRLQNVLRQLNWRVPDDQPLAEIMAKPFREKSMADGLVSREKNGLACHPDIVEVLTREAVAAGVFLDITRVAEVILPLNDDPYAHDRERESLRIRKIRIAVYGGEDQKVLERLGLKGWSFDATGSEVTRILVNICTRPFDRQWFDGLAPSIRFQVLAYLLEESAGYLNDSGAAWQLMVDYFGTRPPHPEVAFFLADQWLYRGMPERAEAVLPDDSSSRYLSRLGWIRFLQGKNTEAIQRYEAALKAKGRRTRKRNIYIAGLPGVCFILALLRGGEQSHRELAIKQVLMAEKVANDDRFDAIFRLLGDLLSILAGEMNVKQSVWLQREPLSIEPWLDLFRCLALHWMGVKPRPPQIANLPKYCPAAATAGLAWYARESALLLKQLGKGDGCTAITAEASKDPAFHPITELVRPEAPWERALRSLKGIREGGADDTEAAASNLRMTWRLGCYRDSCILEP
ncbi:MAG: hypothetical protein GY731_14845, partial [Gammaproteobacteria bacterium]|nr:hypothetical protein [Gammaproteobacteria bacterium]